MRTFKKLSVIIIILVAVYGFVMVGSLAYAQPTNSTANSSYEDRIVALEKKVADLEKIISELMNDSGIVADIEQSDAITDDEYVFGVAYTKPYKHLWYTGYNYYFLSDVDGKTYSIAETGNAGPISTVLNGKRVKIMWHNDDPYNNFNDKYVIDSIQLAEK